MKNDLCVEYGHNLVVGENPIWDYRKAALMFIDIRGKSIYRRFERDKKTEIIKLPQEIGCLALCENGDMLLGLCDGVYRMNEKGELALAHQKTRIKGRRFNDGKIGPDGAFYLGTTDNDGMGAFYRLRDGQLEELFDGCACSNGIDWSRSSEMMYYIDSPRQMIETFDFDVSEGKLSNRRKFMDIPKKWGLPDGMTLDVDDNIWLALWGGERVIHIDKDSKEIIQEIKLPCPKVSSCAFGGEDLRDIYVTTAAMSDIPSYPSAGSVYKVASSTCGKKINYYKY